MSSQLAEPNDTSNDLPAVPEDSQPTAESRAASRLARDVHLIRGWMSTVLWMAKFDPLAWEWRFPDTLFGQSYDIPPVHLFGEIDAALRRLASAGQTEAAVLVELHRSVDAAAESCRQLAELARGQDVDEIREYDIAFMDDAQIARVLLKGLLKGSEQSVGNWFRLGDRVGELFAGVGRRSSIWFLRTIRETLDEAAIISAADVGTLREMRIFSGDPRYINAREFASAIQGIDEELMRSLAGARPFETWIVLNDQRQVLTFLGADIAFDEFSEFGGIAILRVLMQHPGRPFSVSEIVKIADLSVSHIAPYLSRFRAVINRTQDKWPAIFKNTTRASSPPPAGARQRAGSQAPRAHRGRRQLAESAFIVSDPRARLAARSKETFYKLDLPSYRVMHVPLAMPVLP